jgi:hypothetical protein
MQKLIKNQSGSYIAAVLILIVIITILGITFLSKSKLDMRLSGDSSKKKAVDYAAESAIKMVAANLKELVLKYSNIDLVNMDTPTSSYSEPEVTSPFDRNSYITSCKGLNDGNEQLCSWLATKAELSTNLPSIDQNFNISIVRMDRKVEDVSGSEPYPWNKSLTDFYQVPFLTEYPEYKGLYSEKRIYAVTIKAKAEGSGATSSMQAMLTVYGVPMTQWLLYSNYDVTIAPSDYTLLTKGRFHTNSHFRLGTRSYPARITPLTFDEKVPVVTATKNIWNIGKLWHIKMDDPEFDHDIHDWYTNKIGVEVSAGSEVYFQDHLPKIYENDATLIPYFNYYWKCDASDDLPLWREVPPSDYYIHAVHVNTEDSEFQGRLKENVDPIYPPWFPKAGDSYEPRDLIEPGNSVPDGIADSNELKDFRLYYKAKIRLLRGNDGVIRSLDKDGNEITTGKFSAPELMTMGAISYEPSKFFEPTQFRNANTITVDMSKFKNDSDYNGAVIYVGSLRPASGQLQIPTPGCTGPQLYDPNNTPAKWAYTPKCVDDSGNNCLLPSTAVICDATQVGSLDVVRIKNGPELNEGGISVATNRPVYVQGNYNTVNKKSAAIFADTMKVLSNSWEKIPPAGIPCAGSGCGWLPNNVTGPQPVTEDVTQNLAIFAGLDHDMGFISPFLEQYFYKDATTLAKYKRNVTLNTSLIRFWKSKYMPPKAGSVTLYNWDRMAYGAWLPNPQGRWVNYYTNPNLIVNQDISLGSNPPPGTDKSIFVTISSIKEVESN